jgi:hypothetical protein
MDEPLGIAMDLATSNWGGRYACVKGWSRLVLNVQLRIKKAPCMQGAESV